RLRVRPRDAPQNAPGSMEGTEFRRDMRLTRIQIRDYRAFPGDFELRLPKGCNLLLYGENGSGKSSLAAALRDFIALDRPLPRPIGPHAHAFPDPATRQPRVQLTFDQRGV